MIIKLFFATSDIFLLSLVTEILVFLIVYSVMMNYHSLLGKREVSPISLVIGVVVFNLVILMMFNMAEWFFNLMKISSPEIWGNKYSLEKIFPFVMNILLIISLSYIFIVFRELFFLRMRRNLKTYFNALIIFFLLSSVTAYLKEIPDWEFIYIAFTVNAIILIVINSARISWIAFLNKKQKKNLLYLSIFLVILFSVMISYTNTNEFSIHIVKDFTPSIHQFMFLLNIYGIVYFIVLFFTTLFHLPTAEVFDRKATEISSLQYFSKMINQVLDPNELADTITELALKVCNADAAWIVKFDNKKPKTISPKNIDYNDAKIIVEYLFDNRNAKFLTEITSYDISNILIGNQPNDVFKRAVISPIKSHQTANQYLVIAHKSDYRFDDEDKNTLQTFSDYSSIAFENSRLLEESIEKERLEKELDVAREMQKKLLPRSLPQNNYVDICAMFIPAFEVGGDYYDFFELGENKLGFVIADVSGKGISAAFIMAEIKGIFESLSGLIESPKEILTKANMILKRTLDAKSFITATFGVFDFTNQKLFVARAGHSPLLLVHDNQIKEHVFKGIGLGLNYTDLFSNALEDAQIDLIKDDVLVLFTDGITEAKNESRDDFGIEKLKQIIFENQNQSADVIAGKVITAVTLFSQGSSQNDDVTLVVFKWK